jgi:hypothetical protein
LGSETFDERHTAFAESLEEVGGRNEQVITVSGVVLGESSLVGVEARLDAIVDAASVEDYSAVLSLRTGRRMLVRRNSFRREVARDSLVGSFTLELAAKSPFEEAVSEVSSGWTVTASGQTKAVTAVGNVFSLPRITLVATGSIVDPSFGDGTRTILYSGVVADGETLAFDGAAGVATLEGVDVTPYTTGEFPRVSPEGTTLTYVDDAGSSHTAAVTVAYRDRWW